MEVFDTRMEAAALPVFEARKRFTEELKPVIQSYYKCVRGISFGPGQGFIDRTLEGGPRP